MKYDKSNIMRNAWEIRRTANVSMSIALKAAWALEKTMMQAEEDGKDCGDDRRENDSARSPFRLFVRFVFHNKPPVLSGFIYCLLPRRSCQ